VFPPELVWLITVVGTIVVWGLNVPCGVFLVGSATPENVWDAFLFVTKLCVHCFLFLLPPSSSFILFYIDIIGRFHTIDHSMLLFPVQVCMSGSWVWIVLPLMYVGVFSLVVAVLLLSQWAVIVTYVVVCNVFLLLLSCFLPQTLWRRKLFKRYRT
jgi:hypothetical protein